MGQKVNPIGMRIGLNKDWSSRWFANDKDYSTFLLEDIKIREYLEKTIERTALLSKIDIERKRSDKGYRIDVYIYAGRAGMIFGEKGQRVEALTKQVTKLVKNSTVKIHVFDVSNINLDARIVANQIAMQLEQRASFRIAQKKAIMTSRKSGAQGVKTKVSGRLGGAEIAREEGYSEGIMAINTLKTDIDYCCAEANTTYGKLGVTVWISRGEKEFNKFNEETAESKKPVNKQKPQFDNKDRKPHEKREASKGE